MQHTSITEGGVNCNRHTALMFLAHFSDTNFVIWQDAGQTASPYETELG